MDARESTKLEEIGSIPSWGTMEDKIILASGVSEKGRKLYAMYEERFGAKAKMNILEEVIRHKKKYIGGYIRTDEGGDGLRSTVKDITLENGIFAVYTTENNMISANIDFAYPYETEHGFSFRIPFIGRAYINEKIDHHHDIGGEG